MRTINPVQPYPYAMGNTFEPIASVRAGETVEIVTEDAFEGALTHVGQRPSEVLGKYLNPQTGPILVEGAEPGDTLLAKIENIELTRDFAVSCFIPEFGGLTTTKQTPGLQDPIPERVFIYKKQEDGTFKYDGAPFSIEPRPFMGTIGTAPDLEVISSLAPHSHGGNMDVPDTCAGNTVHLPVRNRGAYFFVGDCHAAQGEGEACGVALEIPCKVTITFDLIKGASIEWPRITSDSEIMTVGSARPMEDAARIANRELVFWLEEMGMERWDAYQLITQAGGLYVGNMVDTNYSLVAKLDKRFIPKAALSTLP